jgi:hypothetical protein
MEDEKSREEEVERDPKRRVNPAARHDPERSQPGDPRPRSANEQVPPVQEEPLDPLGPGGIGD